jgi:hypothetical protein
LSSREVLLSGSLIPLFHHGKARKDVKITKTTTTLVVYVAKRGKKNRRLRASNSLKQKNYRPIGGSNP